MTFHTVPNWDALVTQPVKEAGGSEEVIFLCLAAAIFFHALHMISYFHMVKNAGAVSVGVLKSGQAIGIFAVSAWAFCGMQESQCATRGRAVACGIVCGGVVMYSWTKTRRGKGKGRLAKSKANK
jgi:hypothetical protein